LQESAKHKRRDLPVAIPQIIEKLINLDVATRPTADAVLELLADIAVTSPNEATAESETALTTIIPEATPVEGSQLERRLSYKVSRTHVYFSKKGN
jgi:hypothetical protein